MELQGLRFALLSLTRSPDNLGRTTRPREDQRATDRSGERNLTRFLTNEDGTKAEEPKPQAPSPSLTLTGSTSRDERTPRLSALRCLQQKYDGSSIPNACQICHCAASSVFGRHLAPLGRFYASPGKKFFPHTFQSRNDFPFEERGSTNVSRRITFPYCVSRWIKLIIRF